MLVTTPRLAWLVACGAPLLAAGLAQPSLLVLPLVWNLALVVACLADALATAPAGRLSVERCCPASFSERSPATVALRVRNGSAQRLRVEVRDDVPGHLGQVADPPAVTVAPGATGETAYPVTPPRRGRARLGGVTLRWRSPLGLFDRQAHYPLEREIRVYPNLRALQRGDLRQQAGRRLEAGLRTARLRGAGTEFESLREYQPDDEYRRIHWGATARRGRLVTRQVEVERSQTVILGLDVGRLMTCRLDDRTRLDHALDAALLLASIAVQLHDQVGLLVFAEEPLTWLPPGRGRAQVSRLLDAVFDLEGRLVEPDYGAALRLLRLRQRKRSLVVLFTDLVDSVASESLLTWASALRPAHLPIVVSFTDPTTLALARQWPAEAADVYERALASQVLSDRALALDRLRAHGLGVVDAPPAQAAGELVDRYLDAKLRLLL